MDRTADAHLKRNATRQVARMDREAVVSVTNGRLDGSTERRSAEGSPKSLALGSGSCRPGGWLARDLTGDGGSACWSKIIGE